jgi:hypothetical protein
VTRSLHRRRTRRQPLHRGHTARDGVESRSPTRLPQKTSN